MLAILPSGGLQLKSGADEDFSAWETWKGCSMQGSDLDNAAACAADGCACDLQIVMDGPLRYVMHHLEDLLYPCL